MSTMSRNIIISIEGNIGSGKSTLLQYLKENISLNVVFLKEPVDEWEHIRDAEGTTMLQKFYENQEKYSFSFQMMAFISRLALLKETMRSNPGAIIITERSLYTDKLVFAKMLFESGKMEDVNYQIYLKWFDTFSVDCPVDKIIYVNAEPTVCHERIFKRLRTGEQGIPIEYLTSCHEYHTKMLQEMQCKTLVLDGNIDITKKDKQLIIWAKQINEFILQV
jgi:deoxyadenosine/deoxycytidine kinase